MHSERFTYGNEDEYQRHVIGDAKTGYEMRISYREGLEPRGQVAFLGHIGKAKIPEPITTRDLHEYLQHCPSLHIAPRKTTIEVGAGLGEFTPKITQHPDYRPEQTKATVIDPVDYESLEALLTRAIETATAMNLKDDVIVRLIALQTRCRIIQNPELVNLINTTLLQAIQKHPELQCSADYVVEMFSAGYYKSTETGKRTKHPTKHWEDKIRGEYEKLLKPHGKIFMPRYTF